MDRDYPAERFASLVGTRIVTVANNPDADEGLLLTLDDGHVLSFGFSGCEGFIKLDERDIGGE